MEVVQVHVRTLREARGMSVRSLARTINMRFGTLARKERGELRWTVDELARCAQALGVCLSDVVTLPVDPLPACQESAP